MKLLRTALLLLSVTSAAAAQSPVTITVDLKHPLGDYKPITAWFGYDELNYTTTPNGRALLRELHDAYAVSVHIRAHHLLTSGNGVPELKWSSTNVYTLDVNGHAVYDFTLIDKIFDAYKQARVHPMVEFGFMPEALASGPPPYQVHYPRSLDGSSQSPPSDYAAWKELCRRVTEHLASRYGKAEAATWYWEVWNEPDIAYWHGTQAEYFKLYDFAVAGIRAALPEAKVGGPATTSPRSPHAAAFLRAFLDHIANDPSAATHNKIPLDFISFHIKGQPTLIGGTPDRPAHVRMGLDKEITDADKGFALIASFPQFRALPIILSEADPEGCAACSARENPANAYRNGPLYPVYTAATLKALFELQDRYKVNLVAMLSWSFEFEDKDYFEGFRTLATNGIDKPILNFFRMAGRMSGQRVLTTSTAQISLDSILASGVRQSPDIDALATIDHHSAAILVWSYHDDELPADPANVTVQVQGFHLKGIKSSLIHAQQFRIDDTHSNAYTAWKAMGSPQHPTREQIAQLKLAGQLESIAPSTPVFLKDGTLTLALALPRQATSLILLTW